MRWLLGFGIFNKKALGARCNGRGLVELAPSLAGQLYHDAIERAFKEGHLA
jgi:hypothetical protein